MQLRQAYATDSQDSDAHGSPSLSLLLLPAAEIIMFEDVVVVAYTLTLP